MDSFITFVKKWTLIFSLIVGTVVYFTFSNIPLLEPVGDYVGPKLVSCMPVVIFLILYVTFCKMQLRELKPHVWHFILQLIRTSLAGIMVVLTALAPTYDLRLLCEGIFVCVVCPTAAAAPVIVDKLGGKMESMTVYILIANCFTIVIIPLFFPLVERGANITFMMAFLLVLKRVVMVLIVPLILALLSRRFLPKLVEWIRSKRNLAFYLWAFNLSIVMGLADKELAHAPVSSSALLLYCTVPLFICLFQFGLGKAVGAHFGDSITAGQALGQKNTVVGIWLTITFLNPYAAIAPCAYVVWQNVVNAIQLYYKDKYGYLKW